ncbi:MAG: putative toxin-antitoxin system toxin component, PIN family [Betaproteobacteria bacterium]|nr:putative toxin-antitoxin system toxin component, PIN family [Betaproteobacteria bacterium]
MRRALSAAPGKPDQPARARVRIVLEPNVVLSALLWRGTPHHLLAAIGQRSSIQLRSSTALLEERADVLSRPSAAKRLALIDKNAREVLTDYIEAIELVEPASVPRVVADDVDNDHVIAAAVAAHADLIVSGDRKHLLPLGSHQGIPIVEAAPALRRIASG